MQKRIGYLLFLLFLTSCGNFSEVRVGEVKELIVNGFEDNALIMALRVPVENPTRHKITVTGLDLKVFMNDRYVGKVNSTEHLVLPARSNDQYNMELEVRVANFFGTALTLMNLKKGQKINFRIDGVISARSILIKKNIEITEERQIII
jgi:LEA14-like dessication related protein